MPSSTHTHPCYAHEMSDSLTPPGHVEHSVHMDDPTNLLKVKENRTLRHLSEMALGHECLPNVTSKKSKLSM